MAMNTPTVTNKALSLLPALPAFLKTYNLLKKSQWWDSRRLEEYQMRQLTRLLEHAYAHVPYYRRVFDERGLKPSNIQDFNDLRKLPCLTKETIRDNLADLRPASYPLSRLEYTTTGGSTGIPLGLYYERGVSRAVEWAFVKAMWDRVGYRFRDRCVILRGNVVSGAAAGMLWEPALFGRWLIMSSYHLTKATAPQYIDEIRRFRPAYIQAYPSSIIVLADFMEKHGVGTFPGLRAVLCGSENLYPWQRELIEKALGCRVYSWYGHAERAALAGECEHETAYHIASEYGYIELLGKDDRPVTADGETGEIVATGLTTFAFPMIRYRTGDVAEPFSEPCRCGRAYPRLKGVSGRLQEIIITGRDRRISMTAINMHSNVFDNVAQFQFFQEKKGEVVFNVVTKNGYGEGDTNNIRAELLRKLGDDVRLELRFVDNIPRTGRGKYRFLVQKLPVSFADNADG